VVLTPSDAESAAQVAERLRSNLAQLEVPSGAGSIRFTVSIGLHMVAEGETVDEAMKAADIALYEAKMAGKNRVCTR
jgi:diguanylate cyclase (GGDEF)-like protein